MTYDKVVVRNLGKRFRASHPTAGSPGAKGDFWALRGVSFSVGAGEIMGVVGPNGAGKSTLLRLIGGLGLPTEGEVDVRGRLGALLELGAGFFGDLSGRENATLAGIVAGLTRDEIEARMNQIVNFAGLAEFIDEPVRHYSSGMSIRLAFSVAVHSEPEVLLVDEFLAVGDLAFQAKCLAKIETMRQAGCAIVLVSHGMGSIRDVCHQAIWLKGGIVHAQGTAKEVADRYESDMREATLARTPEGQVTEIDGGRSLETRKNRFGSGEVEIRAVRLIPGPSVTSRASLAVEIDFVAKEPVKSPVFVVSLTKVSGPVCVDLNTEASTVAVPDLSGPGRMRLTIERLDLAQGQYRVSVGVFRQDWDHAYDFHWEAYPLEVEGRGGGKGVMAPPTSWKLIEL